MSTWRIRCTEQEREVADKLLVQLEGLTFEVACRSLELASNRLAADRDNRADALIFGGEPAMGKDRDSL